MKNRHKITLATALTISTLFFINARQTAAPVAETPFSQIEKGFQTPPDSVKPSVYWYWLSDNISADGVKKDLEAMAKIGIGRAFIGNIGLDPKETPYGNVKLFTEGWWDVTRQALKTGCEVGVDIGLFNSPGWSQSGGPWIKPTQTMRYLASSEVRVHGPQRYAQKLTTPHADFQDVAVLAFPAPANDADKLSSYQPTVTTSTPIKEVEKLVDDDTSTAVSFGKEKTLTIDIQLVKSITARSLTISPAQKPFRAACELQVADGANYRTVSTFELNRSNPALNVGFMPYGPVAISIPATTGTHFRLVMTGMSANGGLADINLSAAPVVERYVEKQLAKMFQTPLPLWNEYQWTTPPEPNAKGLTVDPTKVITLTKALAPDGTLTWNVPAGDWVVVRFGMTATGVTNAPAAPEGRGPEVDKMSKAAVESHFDAFMGNILNRIPAADRRALKWVVADSYETGSQNWTDGLAADFRQKYGYDPTPWLPVLTGRIVGTAAQSDRFLWDVRRLVADRVAYQYVGGLRDVSNRHGLKLWLENYGHWGFPGEFLQYGGQSDEVGGEFWNEGDLGSIECKAASSAAHIYGKNKVSAESFTAGGLAYQRYPALLKKRGDWSFTEGINNTLLHVFITQPYPDKVPGVNAGFGTEFNRNNIWFDQSKAFVDYLRRCMFMLQQGKPVNDVAYFIGEDAPKMTGVRNPELPQGYSFDYINAEVLQNRVSVKDGRLVLPDGMSYRLLVLPQLATMRPELLRKLRDLVAQGAVILGPKPSRSPSMQNFPAADNEVRKLAAELWGSVDGKTIKSAKFGKGMVLSGVDMTAALNQLAVLPDVKLGQNGPVGTPTALYTHRATAEGDLYFVTNQTSQQIRISPEFRVAGKQPECWNPVTGTLRNLPEFTANAGSTTVPLTLEPLQSCFVVFRKSATPAVAGATNFPAHTTQTTLTNPWTITFDAAKRGPAKALTMNTLTDWTKHTDEAINHYSGTATYATTFTAKKPANGDQLLLDLGMVNVMARVTLNGVDVGTVWTAPWQVDISRAVRDGENKLDIAVVNTWVNRLIGDSKLPVADRKTWTNVNIYKPDSKLQPSGLVGPVTVQSVALSGKGTSRN